MPPRSGGVRSIGWSGEHSPGPQYVEAGCIPVARSRGKDSGTAKNPVALGVGNDRSELARESPVLAQRDVRTPAGRDRWAPAQVAPVLLNQAPTWPLLAASWSFGSQAS